MITVAAPEHPLAQHEGPLPTSMLTNHIQLVLTDRSNLTQGTDYGVLSGHTWRLADLSTKHTFLKAGFGWGNMPAHKVDGDLQKEQLVRIYPAEWQEQPQIPQFMIYRSSNPPGPAGQWLLERLAAAFNGKSHE
jgi:DNA-binding transcriptional LysR family regulator